MISAHVVVEKSIKNAMENREALPNQEGQEGEIDWSANELVLPSDLKMVDALRGALDQRLAEFDWEESDINRVKLAADEALTNAIVHGNLDLPGREIAGDAYFDNIKEAMKTEVGKRRVQLKMDINNDFVEIIIKDEGKGIPLEVPDPSKDENMHKHGGRGMFFIRFNANQVAIDGSEITMRFVKNKKT